VSNTIVYFNTASGVDDDIVEVAGTVGYSCSPDLVAGPNGNLDANPKFVDRPAGNYRLDGGSPCADQGLIRGWMGTAVDLDDSPRVQGAAVDMGAYELEPPAGTLILVR